MAHVEFRTPDEPLVWKDMGGFATYETAEDYALHMLAIEQWIDVHVWRGSSRRSPERA